MRSLVLVVVAAAAVRASAQELEPRSYSASPIGASFFVASYSYSAGGILFDPTVPVTDVHAEVSSITPGYGHAFAIGHVQALFTAALPYAWGPFTGSVTGLTTDSTIHRAGVGDLRVKFSANFIGSPALTPAEFAKRSPSRFILGASLAIVAPTGQYFPEKLINIGANRWAFKPEVGISYNWKAKLYLDLYTGVWFFGTNHNFYPGQSTQRQDPLVSLQLHASYNFLPRTYLALESTWYSGGQAHINDGPPSERTDNTRLGLLFAYGFTAKQSVKVSWSYGASVRVGSAYDTYALAYQVLWF
jgi:outer membrane putative beta-barrel porin/alpha-amylase